MVMVFECVAVIAVTAEAVNEFQKLTQALLRAVVPAPFVSSAKQVYDGGAGAGGGGNGGGGSGCSKPGTIFRLIWEWSPLYVDPGPTNTRMIPEDAVVE